jgi:hypothetical protein
VFSNKVFRDRLISGVDATIEWQYLEPNKSGSCHFDWTLLNQMFRQAKRFKKFVVLSLKPGFGTPTWALSGVKTVTTAWSYHSVQVKPQPLPLPWDKLYLKRWFAFLRHVARRYGSNPQFRMIAVGGPTSISDEMSLPDWTGSPPYGTEADFDPKYPHLTTTAEQYPRDSDLAMWMGQGYTPDRYVGAWRSAFKTYHELFPHQYMSLALIPGLPIGNDRTLDASQITATPLAVIAAGRRYGSSFVLQANGLGAGSERGGPPEPYVQGNCGTITTGFQTHAPSLENADGAPLNTDDLQAGVNAAANFIEVYEQDVLDGLAGLTNGNTADQTIEDALKTAHRGLHANPGCDPLTLSATAETATIGTAATVTATLGPSATSCPTITGSCPNLLNNATALMAPPGRQARGPGGQG